MSIFDDEPFYRIGKLPPYVFAVINEMRAKARAAQLDVIDLGMGNPDGATPRVVVQKMAEAARLKRNHRYSLSRGIPRLREAITKRYKANYDVDPKQVRKVLDARNDLRATLRIPADQGTNDSMAQLNSMSKFLAAAGQGGTRNEEAPEVAERRRLLVKARGQVSRLLEQSLEVQAAAGTTTGTTY